MSAGLEMYITKTVEDFRAENGNRFPPELIDKIKQALREGAHGAFLWVSFVAKDLRNREAAEVERCLEDLPAGLGEVYARILNHVDPGRRDLVRKILRWCAFAQRPLELWELASVLAPQPSADLHAIDTARSYVAYCGHFVVLVPQKGKFKPHDV